MELDIFGDIGDFGWSDSDSINTVQSIRKKLANLKDGEELTVYLNSPGGYVTEGIAIYNLLAEKKPTIKIIGEASSIASVIACAGSKVLIAETAVMLFHKPWGYFGGDEDDLEKLNKNLKVLKESIITAYQSKTTMSKKALDELMQEDTYHNAKKCVEMGFADEIYTPSDDDKAKIEASNKLIAKQLRQYYNSSKNNYLLNKPKEISEMDNTNNAEMEKLREVVSKTEKDFAVLNSKFEAQTQSFNELQAKYTQANEQLAKLTKENNALAEANQMHIEKQIEQSVDMDLIKLQDKIKPVENCKENNFALKQELMWLKSKDDDKSAIINGKTPYERKLEELASRPSLNSLTEPIASEPVNNSNDLSNININNNDDRLALHNAALDYSKKNNIGYFDALQIIIEGRA